MKLGIMKANRKAQSEAITLVLVTGIIIALVGSAYMWGKPMIDKRSIVTQFASATKFMEDLNAKIVNMAGTCSFEGACEETLSLPVPGGITLDEATNSLIYTFPVTQPLILGGGEVLFNTADNNTVARYGETPGVISLRGERDGSGNYNLIFRLRYRELDSQEPWKGYKIQLVRSGQITTGASKILLSYAGPQTQQGAAYNNGDLVLSRIKVQPV
jgi:hypothetical protein